MRLMPVLVALAMMLPCFARAEEKPLKIGVIGDMSGPYSDFTGRGSVEAVRMAVRDAGGRVLGRPIEVVAADHLNKPDVGVAIVRRWIDEEGVDVLAQVGNSGVALAIEQVSREKNRIALITGAAASDITGPKCSPVAVHWVYDTWGQAHGTTSAILKEGGKSWFYISADYVFGKMLEAESSAVVNANGGRVLGHAPVPLNTADFSSALLQAQSSGAEIIGVANAGTDLINTIKQASEFGLTAHNQRMAALILYITDVKALGLQAAQGLEVQAAFYWDQDEATRAWSKRFYDAVGQMPSQAQAGDYSAVAHYLKAVAATGTTDAAPVMAKMREMPIEDFMSHGAKLRIDGRVEREMYLFRVKSPADSKGPWDLYQQIAVIPAAQATRPLNEGGCPLVTQKP